ncbi:hypothetical protein ACFFV7_46745 [Nonomuraea spiralis]|uniref:Uncharacterized protein n=1 Tax=Nonomuraea spiralis TaxID=46182 RepID=A0ABV5IW81_9ACTN|nr:hypothetical protein [Nonomuraea spiralis]
MSRSNAPAPVAEWVDDLDTWRVQVVRGMDLRSRIWQATDKA